MNIGLVGYGAIARAHVHAFHDVPLFFPKINSPLKIKWVCGRNENKAMNFARNNGVEIPTTNYKDVLRDSSVEIIDNVLQPRSHHDTCIEAFEAGKNVICEKPLAASFEDALKMYRIASRSGLTHGVMYNYRWLPAMILAKKMISRGDLGKIYHFRGSYLSDYGLDSNIPLDWHYVKREAGAGALADLGTHVIDAARFLVGEIKNVCGTSRIIIKDRPMPDDSSKRGLVENDDEFAAHIEFEDGIKGSIEASRITAGNFCNQYIEVNGNEGSLYWSQLRPNELNIYTIENNENSGFKRILVSKPTHPYINDFYYGSMISVAEGFVIAMYEFIESVKANRDFIPSFYDGAVNLGVIEGILKSIQSERWVQVPQIQK